MLWSLSSAKPQQWPCLAQRWPGTPSGRTQLDTGCRELWWWCPLEAALVTTPVCVSCLCAELVVPGQEPAAPARDQQSPRAQCGHASSKACVRCALQLCCAFFARFLTPYSSWGSDCPFTNGEGVLRPEHSAPNQAEQEETWLLAGQPARAPEHCCPQWAGMLQVGLLSTHIPAMALILPQGSIGQQDWQGTYIWDVKDPFQTICAIRAVVDGGSEHLWPCGTTAWS